MKETHSSGRECTGSRSGKVAFWRLVQGVSLALAPHLSLCSVPVGRGPRGQFQRKLQFMIKH